MINYRFAPSPPSAAPIAGSNESFPIQRIFCVGRNYEAHAAEMGVIVDRDAPFYFTKSASAYVPSGDSVPYPPGTSNYQYEIELVVAIGAPAFLVSPANALNCVFGYACGLDMTRRDLQLAAREQRRPWDLGKDFENSAVLSVIEPAERIGHPSTGTIELRVNGTVRQSADLRQMVHSVPALIADLTRFYHLRPGDLIFAGTPEGVGPVKPGDRIEGSIAGVGSIALQVEASAG
jgi:fumarylpyruvate hydrolase